MKITCDFDPKFRHENVIKERFILDIDPSDTIDNLKIIITLKYNNIDPNSIEIVFGG